MPVPILLITGALGAGKTTLINRLLREPGGRRLAAIVNDFGTINIDAALLASVSDDVISLKNGCICCSLLGDLLQTLSTILRRVPAPDGIVIETSGVSDPAEIVRTLLDPVIWSAAALDTIVCVVDARAVTDQSGTFDDTLWKAQVAASDYVALSKTDLVSAGERDDIRRRLRNSKAEPAIHEMIDGALPPELCLSGTMQREPMDPTPGFGQVAATPSFQTMTWQSASPLILSRFQDVIGRLASRVVRAKGFVTFAERPGEMMLFQFVGSRATISPAPPGVPRSPAAQLVVIARRGMLDEFGLTASLQRCRADHG